MMEAEAIRLQYEVGAVITEMRNSGIEHVKQLNSSREAASTGIHRKCHSCFGPESTSLWAGLLTNIGICTLLFSYTLLGSFIFLAIEGETVTMKQRTLVLTNRQQMTELPSLHRAGNISLSPAAISDAFIARQRTVENIWDITVSLNILYRENWTRLAALEIVRLQNKLVKRFAEDIASQLGHNGLSAGAVVFNPNQNVAEIQDYEWTFAQAFLYSLTVLTTIGYGNLAPKTALGKVVTLTYAILGIPLTLVYLSSTGGVLARVARGVFSRALCCCLCSNCGYCCYDEKRMAEKERRMKKKRQQEEFRAQHFIFQDPYNAQSGTVHNSLHSSDKQIAAGDADSLSSLDSNVSMHGLSLLAPIILCVSIMGIYISLGAIALYRLEGWCFLDGVYFCFMSLSTIGFGDVVPSLVRKESSTIVWFCSLYIMLGMALTAMCFNVVHQEIVHRIQHYERTANLYQQNPTEDTLIRGTTTSCRGLFPDVNQLHIPRGSVTHNLNYNLTPVASMEPNNSSNPPCIPTVLLPEVLDDVSQMFQLAPVKESQPSNFIIDQKLIQQAIVVQSVLTGVYTLSEEPELEGDNTQLKGDSP